VAEHIGNLVTQESDIPSAAQKKIRGRVTVRAVILALLLTVANNYWLVQLEVVRYSFATYAAPFYNCIFTLLVVTSVNMLIKRARPRLAFDRVELLTVYVMLSISSAICSHNMMQILVAIMGHSSQFQTPENNWGALFVDKLPHWLTVSDPVSLKNLYYGSSSFYEPRNFGPWIVPILWWSAFSAVLLSTMLCINSILRKQWVESERLTFPVIMLPLEMTDESGSLFKNRYMWIGFGIAGAITLVAGLHHLFPSIPYIPIVRRNFGQYIVDPPWNAMGSIVVGFYFWAIGISFLMPLELSFSCWVFHWLVKLELVLCRTLGLNEIIVQGGGFDRTYPFLNSQSYGAYLGFFVLSMWSSRRYLGRVFRTALLRTKEEDESREAVSYRTAVLGAAAGFVFLVLFSCRIGMTPWVVVAFFFLYFVFAVIIGRIRAELGFPTHDMHVMAPTHALNTAAGTENLQSQNLIGFSLFHWFNRTYASHPSPHQLESFKLVERTSTLPRQMFAAVMIAGIFAMPLGFWMLLHNYYHYGGATARMEMWPMQFGRECWGRLESWLNQPTPPNGVAMAFVGGGFTFSVLLGWLRTQFLGFPFHPLAYAISNSWGIQQLWMPLFIGSTAKFLILKAGGLRSYRAAIPFFLGLILGEITIGSLWTIIGIVLGIPTYDFWPGRYR
jgi:hypothetical protein